MEQFGGVGALLLDAEQDVESDFAGGRRHEAYDEARMKSENGLLRVTLIVWVLPRVSAKDLA